MATKMRITNLLSSQQPYFYLSPAGWFKSIPFLK